MHVVLLNLWLITILLYAMHNRSIQMESTLNTLAVAMSGQPLESFCSVKRNSCSRSKPACSEILCSYQYYYTVFGCAHTIMYFCITYLLYQFSFFYFFIFFKLAQQGYYMSSMQEQSALTVLYIPESVSLVYIFCVQCKILLSTLSQ